MRTRIIRSIIAKDQSARPRPQPATSVGLATNYVTHQTSTYLGGETLCGRDILDLQEDREGWIDFNDEDQLVVSCDACLRARVRSLKSYIPPVSVGFNWDIFTFDPNRTIDNTALEAMLQQVVHAFESRRLRIAIGVLPSALARKLLAAALAYHHRLERQLIPRGRKVEYRRGDVIRGYTTSSVETVAVVSSGGKTCKAWALNNSNSRPVDFLWPTVELTGDDQVRIEEGWDGPRVNREDLERLRVIHPNQPYV